MNDNKFVKNIKNLATFLRIETFFTSSRILEGQNCLQISRKRISLQWCAAPAETISFIHSRFTGTSALVLHPLQCHKLLQLLGVLVVILIKIKKTVELGHFCKKNLPRNSKSLATNFFHNHGSNSLMFEI